jgi:nucleoside-diphosphate-sugar epimerase
VSGRRSGSAGPALVTGASGSVGSALVARLSRNGIPVRAVVRDPSRGIALRELPAVEVAVHDLTRPAGLERALDGCGVVYHCAGKMMGDDTAAYDAVNAEGTRALLRAAAAARVTRFVHLSTIGVYGFIRAEGVDEEQAFGADSNPYRRSKEAAEAAVRAASDSFEVTIARLGPVIGPNQYAWTTQFLELIRSGLSIAPTDRTSGMLNFTYVDNLLDALLELGSHPKAVGEAFNVVDGTPILVSDYIRELAALLDRRVRSAPAFVLRAAAVGLMLQNKLRGRQGVTVESVRTLLQKVTIDNAKLRREIGWSPRVDLDEALAAIGVWARSGTEPGR